MDALYSTTGSVYDIVCFTFYVGGLVWYIHIRQGGNLPRAWQTAALLVLYLGALNSKEMAATWPLILLLYELLYHGLAALRRSWVISAAAVLTALFLGAKLSSASVLVQVYRPRFSVERLLDNWRLLLRVVLWRRPIQRGRGNPALAGALRHRCRSSYPADRQSF